jgi:alpha-galactosidase
MRFGLWFGPDSSNDFSNWEKDAAKILDLHRTTGIDYVKIDGVKAVSKTGEVNLRRFFDRVMNDSDGKVTFDLDVTAEVRPGYFGMMNVGPLFVENRYTDWHRYWPHQTLRNLWKLAQYVDPVRLRMEFLNQTRNPNQYADDPLAPSAYSPAYLFATTMFSNPLGWFETSNLPANYFAEVAPLVKRWKQERTKLFAGTTVPVGEAPDGVAWTGFVSVAADRRSGYALVFREASTEAEWRMDFPLLAKGTYTVTPLGGDGSAVLNGGMMSVKIPQARQFLWVRVEAR